MSKTIVVVDDFENTLRVIQFSLRKIDCEVLTARQGKEALKYFDGRDIDLLITDYNMPIMDGVELIEEIRKMEQYEFIPVLMLTTETKEKKKQRAEEAKVTAFIKKPYEHDVFLNIVKKCLRIS